MVTSPYGASAPSLVNAARVVRKASHGARTPHGSMSSRGDAGSAQCERVTVSPGDGVHCTRVMHMWTPDAHSSDANVTSRLWLYLVDGCESHGECTHVVSFDSSGWRCTRAEPCGAVAIARAEHERTEGHHDRHQTDIRAGR